jgi:hypothetical protein
MKPLLSFSIFIILGINSANCQVPVCGSPIPYNKVAYKILRNIDKTQVPYSVLYEYAFPLAEVDFYDGSAITDTSTYSHFMQSYYELYQSTFNTTGIIRPEVFEKAVYNFHPDKEYHHPVGIIDYNFNTIDPNSVTNNLFTVSNNQLYDVPFRIQTPYINKTARIATPLRAVSDDKYKSGTHYFHFSSAFVLSNSGFNLSQVQTINVKLNGISVYYGVVSGLENVVIPVPVCNDDAKMDIQIILGTSTNSKIYNIAAECEKIIPVTPCRGGDVLNITGYPYDGGYGLNFRAKATATIYYADANCATKRITKPIIFVDGFDPGNKQHAPEIWDFYLNKAFEDVGGVNKQLGLELLANGYDIIILDPIESDSANFVFTGGTSLIENNGLVLASFLESFYTQHQLTMVDDFVVVGASMGGIISRFGLAWMETNNRQHHTRLFVSFDSPQGGAQIPLGLQQMVDAFTQYSILSNIESIKTSLHQSAAAKQMILHHSSQNSETPKAHP